MGYTGWGTYFSSDVFVKDGAACPVKKRLRDEETLVGITFELVCDGHRKKFCLPGKERAEQAPKRGENQKSRDKPSQA